MEHSRVGPERVVESKEVSGGAHTGQAGSGGRVIRSGSFGGDALRAVEVNVASGGMLVVALC